MFEQIQNTFSARDSSLGRICRHRSAPENSRLTRTSRQQDKLHLRPVILCKTCKSHITDSNQAIAVSTTHTHTFPNPFGLVFTIRCFASAPGCVTHGEASPDFSWFSGYDWQIVLCRGCSEHLGWKFCGNDVFFGLIAAKLFEGKSAD